MKKSEAKSMVQAWVREVIREELKAFQSSQIQQGQLQERMLRVNSDNFNPNAYDPQQEFRNQFISEPVVPIVPNGTAPRQSVHNMNRVPEPLRANKYLDYITLEAPKQS